MKKYFLPALLFMAIPLAAFAAGADTALLDRIQSLYGGMDSFTAGFEQTLTHKESGSTEKRDGRLAFQKPLRIRWQTAKPHEETLVVTDKEIWDYLPDEQIAYRYSPDLVKDSRNIIQVITGQSALNRDFEVKSGGKENGLVKLVLYPNEPTTQMVEAHLWVDPGEGYIRRAKIIDFYGNGNDIKLKNINRDARIQASEFSFKPPKGIEVEDRIDKKVEERELFK